MLYENEEQLYYLIHWKKDLIAAKKLLNSARLSNEERQKLVHYENDWNYNALMRALYNNAPLSLIQRITELGG